MAIGFKNLRPASWRGVPFAMTGGSQKVGRRKAQHDYPYRDTIWLEDMGQLPPSFRVQGFLVSESRVYGGGDVQAQRNRLQIAAQAVGQGLLVHPTRGPLQLDLLDLTINERWEEQAYFELDFAFVQGGAQGFPAVLSAVSGLLGSAADLANQAGLNGFAAALGGIQVGVDQAVGLASAAQAWSNQVQAFAGDATALYNTVSQLGGGNYGRYVNAGASGFLQGLSSPYAGAADVPTLLAIGASQRAAVATAAQGLATAVAGYGATHTASDVGAAVQGLVVALSASTANPRDAVRLLVSLSAFSPPTSVQINPAAAAMTDLFRRSTIAEAARAAGQYAPSSSDDAIAVRAEVLAPVNAEVRIAGASAADPVFGAFKGLRQSVFQNLGQRGASLPSLITVESARPLPAAVLAQRKYGDIRRRDELVDEAGPVNPLFMPTAFRALAS